MPAPRTSGARWGDLLPRAHVCTWRGYLAVWEMMQGDCCGPNGPKCAASSEGERSGLRWRVLGTEGESPAVLAEADSVTALLGPRSDAAWRVALRAGEEAESCG